MKKTILALALSIAAFAANAQVNETVVIHQRGTWEAGQTMSFTFHQPTYVEKLMISAESRYANFVKAYVYADGEYVALLGLPGRDPDYPVVIRKQVTNIMMKFEGTVVINDIRAYINSSRNSSMHFGAGNMNSPQGVADSVLKTVAILQETANDWQFHTYLKPLRKAALRLVASGAGRPQLSTMTQEKAQIMIDAIAKAEPFLDKLSERTYYVDAVQNLLFVKERLEAMYEIRAKDPQ